MKGKEGPEGQKLENGAGPGTAKFFIWGIEKTDRLWQLVGGTPRASHHKAKMKEMKAQKARMKEMKAQKPKVKGNEAPQGQNERK